jgi:hypothetical protein
MIDCGFSKMPAPSDEHLNSRTQQNSKQLPISLVLSVYIHIYFVSPSILNLSSTPKKSCEFQTQKREEKIKGCETEHG